MTLIWPSLIILHSPTSKVVHTMLHFKKPVQTEVCRTLLLCLGVAQCPHGWKPFPLVHLKPEWQMYSAQLVSVCHMWRYCQPISQPALSHSHHPLHVSIWLKARPLKRQSQCYCGVLWCACSLRTTSASLVVVHQYHKWRIGVVFTQIYKATAK